MSARPPKTDVALKEWDAVCTALADGAQILLIRKGGIHEKRQRFQFEHDAFWIYPTFAHQPRHIEAFLAVADDVLKILKQAIEDDDVLKRIDGKVKHTGFARLT